MSEEARNIDVVIRSFDALNARDLDAVFEFFTDDCVFDGSRVMEGVYEGKAAYRRFLEGVLDSLGELTHKDFTFLSEGNRVIALTTIDLAGSLSGATSRGRMGYLYEFCEGRIHRQEIHPDGEALLRSLGIDE